VIFVAAQNFYKLIYTSFDSSTHAIAPNIPLNHLKYLRKLITNCDEFIS